MSVESEGAEGVRVTGVTRTPSAWPAPTSVAADPATLEQLEFPRALAEVARRAVGPVGAARVRERLPSADAAVVAGELRAVAELQGLLSGGDGFRPEPIDDVTELLNLARVEGTVLDGAELAAVGRGLEAMRLVRAELARVRESAPLTAALAVEPPPARLGRDLLRILDPDGAVRDGTDDGVDHARQNVRDARTRLIQLLERTLRGLASHEVPPDPTPTVRGGRYVIPVLRDARGRVPGIVHAESGSGATLFVEPNTAVEPGNALAAAEAAEARAVLALLRRLTESLRPHLDQAAAGLEMCVQIDDRYARARYAVDVAAALPATGPAPGAHRLTRARHPLLLAEGVEAVPFDLDLDASELALVVSGPNTGGKTVMLKAVGLINALAQAGVLPPVGDDAAFPVYTAVHADIGDRQSIAASLSTFSAHLVALKRALELAGPGTLILLDEVGAGTDPIEGAALAAAVLETLVARGARVVATTHLSELKQLAARTAGVVNASLQFDAATLTPTYRLAKGIPGRSYGLVIARRLGLPAEVVSEAESRTPAAERSLDAMLADVERRVAEVADRAAELDAAAARLRRLEGELAQRHETLATRETEVAARAADVEREGRQQARRFLLEARKRVEDALGMARAAVTEATAKEARRLVEEGISGEAAALKKLHDDLAKQGWRVKGAIQPPRQPPTANRQPLTANRQPLTAVSEVDLRGMMVDEARDALDRAIDAAVLADLPALRIIHGKGTGALRTAVDQLLRHDRRIASRRLAPPREGGNGVTIAELAG